jgi:hypothetical protein
MYFDLSSTPRSQRPSYRQPVSPRSVSPVTTTTTTTLLPFRRSARPVNVAAALSPVQEYLQPQWAVHPTEPLWAASGVAAAAPRPSTPPPPPQPSSMMRDVLHQQQQQQLQRGAWAINTATVSSQPYYVEVGGGGCMDASSVQLYGHASYREDRAAPPSHSMAAAATFAAAPTVLMSDDVRRAAPPLVSEKLPRQPFASSSTTAAVAERRGSGERSRPTRVAAAAGVGGAAAAAAGVGNGRSSSSSLASPVPVGRSRGRGIVEVRPGCTTATERVRYRNNVTKKLIDLYDEVAELYECRENMNYQVTQAMRSDPRYTKERHGEVRLAYKPTPSQQAAMTAVDNALEALHDACHELVAAYLTPEEKRYLGIDTHLFQTSAERKSTYQYAPAATRGKAKPAQQGAANVHESCSLSSSSTTTSSGSRRHHRTRKHRAQDAETPSATQEAPSTSPQQQQQQQQQLSTPCHSLIPTPFKGERTATTIRADSPSPPSALTMHDGRHDTERSIQFSTPADPQRSVMTPASPVTAPCGSAGNTNNSNNGAAASPVPTTPLRSSNLSPPPPPVQQQSTGVPSIKVSIAQPDDTVALGSVSSPERMYAPAASTSSLGDGAWPSDTASATARAPSSIPLVRSPMLSKMPPGRDSAGGGTGSMTIRGPQGQLLIKVPAQTPSSATAAAAASQSHTLAAKWPPGVPPGAKLARTPLNVAPPSLHQQQQQQQQQKSASVMPSSRPPSHPPSRTNSAINRAASSAPKAPVTRSGFQRFLIDSDSDSAA